MVDNAELFIDPEEDEVFFYGVTEKESQVKSVLENKIQLETGKINESCSNQNDDASEDLEGKIQPKSSLSPIKKLVDFEQITNLNWLGNRSNLLSVPLEKSSENNENVLDKCLGIVTSQENLKSQTTEEYIGSPNKENTPEKNKLDQRNVSSSVVNIHIDHSYFIPINNVIDKNILKTPKSIVKADKDGGFLKVLSEIALVKAEVDENNLGDIKKLNDISCAKELNDDDKENKQSNTEKSNVATKICDLSPAKVCQGFAVNKTNSEGEKNIFCSFENINEDHLGSHIIPDQGSIKIKENGKREFECLNPDIVVNDPIDELCLVKSLSLKEEGSINPGITFEKPNDNLINIELKEKETTQEISNNVALKEFDIFKDKSELESLALKGNEDLDLTSASENNFLQKKSEISPLPELNLSAANINGEIVRKDHSYLSGRDINLTEKERHKKFVRRSTMRLLEELNELVTFGQAKRESLGTVCSEKLSEEAAKVIQKLKAVGFDDSICSPEQYFDLDKLDNSVFNSEISDILNDTLSKPLNCITNKDVESLLEKITSHSLEVENEIYSSDEFNSKNKDVDNFVMSQNLMSESEKFTTEQQKSSPFKAEQFDKISKYENNSPKCGISVLCENSTKLTGQSNILSGNKNIVQKSISSPQNVQTRPKEFKSVEKKYMGLTRIPKLVSTTSKVPVTTKEIKQQLGYPTPNKTPYLKAQKSLKFNNIDNTASTSINSKIPAAFSSAKGKPATKDDLINSKPKIMNKSNTRALYPKSETKLNSQSPKIQSAISLKVKLTESHLPKVNPKILKVPGGDSTIKSKYGSSLQKTIPKRP